SDSRPEAQRLQERQPVLQSGAGVLGRSVQPAAQELRAVRKWAMNIARSTAILVVTGALLLGLTADPVFASVHCGGVITQDTTLHNDLIDCPGAGLTIGAAGISIDLNGHTIDGQGPLVSATGLNNSLGYDN